MKTKLLILLALASGAPAFAQPKKDPCPVPAHICAQGEDAASCQRGAALDLSRPLITKSEGPLANAKSGFAAVVSDPKDMLCGLAFYKRLKEGAQGGSTGMYDAFVDMSDVALAVKQFDNWRIAYVAHLMHEKRSEVDDKFLDDAAIAIKADAETESGIANLLAHPRKVDDKEDKGGWVALKAKASPKVPRPVPAVDSDGKSIPVDAWNWRCWTEYGQAGCLKDANKKTPACEEKVRDCEIGGRY